MVESIQKVNPKSNFAEQITEELLEEKSISLSKDAEFKSFCLDADTVFVKKWLQVLALTSSVLELTASSGKTSRQE